MEKEQGWVKHFYSGRIPKDTADTTIGHCPAPVQNVAQKEFDFTHSEVQYPLALCVDNAHNVQQVAGLSEKSHSPKREEPPQLLNSFSTPTSSFFHIPSFLSLGF
mmetsp:Transcript_1620/g.5600  ORF Transcript_1620/g.5600 Transcript_1620/m.5600 type:complete len:105 (-) Transcript_1620:5107-5421(-)